MAMHSARIGTSSPAFVFSAGSEKVRAHRHSPFLRDLTRDLAAWSPLERYAAAALVFLAAGAAIVLTITTAPV